MTLNVSAQLLTAARGGEVPDEQFAACLRDSLPYPWRLISELATRLHVDGGPYVESAAPPPCETAHGELLSALASDAVRHCLERYFGVRLAFQSSHRVAVFPAWERQPGMASAAYRGFVSSRAQLLNQAPEKGGR